MIVSSRKSVVPTYSTGRVISSALSYVRYPYPREKDRMLVYHLNNTDLRLVAGSNLGKSLRNSLSGFHIDLWVNKRDTGLSQGKNFNFIEGTFRSAKIFSILFAQKSISLYNSRFLTKLVSFIPKKTRSRKKNIFELLHISSSSPSSADFYFFWRIYIYFQFLTRMKEDFADPRSITSSKAIAKLRDLSGLYFLGAGVSNLENYFLSFTILLSSTKGGFVPFSSLSTPKTLRSDFSQKIHSVISYFRFLPQNR